MLAAERATAEEIEQIEAAYAKMNVLIHCDDLSEYIAADFHFHLTIAQASHNQMLVDVMTILKDILYMHYVDMIKAMGPEIGFDYHGQILEAIKARSPEQAAENVRQMINCFIEQLDTYEIAKENTDV
jgi:DNA-binding FadR family transcriptional regulator